MAKTKNTSVRFDTKQYDLLRETYPEFKTGQQVVDFLLAYWHNRVKNESGSTSLQKPQNKPSIFNSLPESIKRRLESGL